MARCERLRLGDKARRFAEKHRVRIGATRIYAEKKGRLPCVVHSLLPKGGLADGLALAERQRPCKHMSDGLLSGKRPPRGATPGRPAVSPGREGPQRSRIAAGGFQPSGMKRANGLQVPGRAEASEPGAFPEIRVRGT